VGRLRILYVHHRPELGGAPSSLSHLLRTLDNDRFEAHVYCPPGPVTELFEDSGATVHEGPVAAFTHIWASTYHGRRWVLLGPELQALPKHVVGFRRTLRQPGFDIVHLNDSPLLPAAWLASHHQLPVVWHLRSSLPERHDLRTVMIRRAVSRLATRSIAITRDVAASFNVGAEVIPNSVDLNAFRPGDLRSAQAEIGIEGGRPVVTFLGFLYPSKGFRDFILAASLLTRSGVDATFLVVGGPVRGAEFFNTAIGRAAVATGLTRDYGDDAMNLVATLGLQDRVTFHPFLRDTSRLYQASDVIVAPSRGPELGRPVIEAAASGRPVVASGSLDGGGIVLPSITGELVPRRSPDALAATVSRLLANDSLREQMGAAARTHAEREFDQERNTDRVMAIYDDIFARAP
jgi:glycosyltransferase involved in cell wall biosynthesis